MQFIEWLFGFSPDGGTGLTEIAIIVSALAAVLIVYRRIARGREPNRKRLL